MEQLVLFTGLGVLFLAIMLAVVTISLTSPRPATTPPAGVFPPGAAPVAAETLRERAGAPLARRLAAIGRAMSPRGTGVWLQRRLDYAGNPAGWPPERIMELQGAGLLAGTVAGGLLGFVLGVGWSSLVGLVVLGALIGLWLPFAIVYDRGTRRQEQIRRELPDGLDLLTLSVEAGLGFDGAATQVAHSMPGPLAREFVRMLQETHMGQRRSDALRALAGRTTVGQLRTLATSLVQAGELGIPIATVLREQSRDMRLRRRQDAEEQARKLPVKVTIPLVLCLFPALFIVVIGPGALRIMHTMFGL